MRLTRIIVILAVTVPTYLPFCINGAEMFVTDPGRGAIYVAASDDNGSFAEANFNALPLQNLMLPWAVVFDNRSRTVFWTDGDLDAILRAKIDGSEQQIIVDGLGYPAGLAIDTVNNRLYWTDYERDVVGSSTLDGTDQTVLVNTGLQSPQGITVSTRNSLLFWADNEANTIERVNTNGSNRKELVSSGLDYPTAVSLDNEEERLYWADFGRGRVESVGINGVNRIFHFQNLQGFSFVKPYGLVLLGKEDRIFYTDSTQSLIVEFDHSLHDQGVPVRIAGAIDQFQDLRHMFISEYAGPLPGAGNNRPSTPPLTNPSTDSLPTGTTELENPTAGPPSGIPTTMLIVIITGASIIGILAAILFVTMIITRPERTSTENKPSSEDKDPHQACTEPIPPNGRLPVPSYVEPDQPIRDDPAYHQYEEPDNGYGEYMNLSLSSFHREYEGNEPKLQHTY